MYFQEKIPSPLPVPINTNMINKMLVGANPGHHIYLSEAILALRRRHGGLIAGVTR
jgi:hypothetical protein